MKKQAEDWIASADKDLSAAEILIKENASLTNIVTFHCQQAIEKYLKAFLIENDILLIRTHDLVKLNGMIKEVKDLGLNEEELVVINEIYIDSIHQDESGSIHESTSDDRQAKEFIEFAKEVKAMIV